MYAPLRRGISFTPKILTIMNKLFLLLALAFFTFGTTLSAQNNDNDSRSQFGVGAKAGLNYSNVWDEQGEDFVADAKLGMVAGIFGIIPFGQSIGFQPEILISQKGFRGSGTLLGTPYSFTRTTTYIDVPLQLQIKPADFVTIVGGPQFSYLFNQKDVYTFGANSTEQQREFDNDNLRKNVLGGVVGADVNLSHLVISGRMGWDFQTNNGDGSSQTPRYKNQWLQFTFGYKL
jgi:hypothetical protein